MPIKGVRRVKDGVIYRGEKFPGFNKPKLAPKGSSAKRRVLAKKGDKVKVVNFGKRGYSDFTQHKDPERRRRWVKRFSGIKKKSGGRAIDDRFSPAFWAKRVLW